MTEPTRPDPAQFEALSALVDGHATSSEAADTCARWQRDPALRARWETYQLIGDALRSGDAVRQTDGGAFLSRLRERLADEPVVLAPGRSVSQPSTATVPAHESSPPLRHRRWAGPLSVAAGFVAVVAALLNTGLGSPPSATPGLAFSGGQGGAMALNQGSVAVAWPQGSAEAAPSFARPDARAPSSVHVLRDPRVEEPVRLRSAEAAPGTFSSPDGLVRQVALSAP